MTEQITTVTFFKMKGFTNQFYGFAQVQLAIRELSGVEGLTFLKTLGTGGGDGFSLRPDFSTYAFLMVWKSRAHADLFFENNSYILRYIQFSRETFTLYLKNAMAHGEWDQKNPFVSGTEIEDEKPVVVVTRARIKPAKLITFWANVGSAAADLHRYSDLLFGVGVGELPAIQQATISVWKKAESMKNFAYQSKHHQKVIKLTRKKKWYQEELFARFIPVDATGTWQGKSLSSQLNM